LAVTRHADAVEVSRSHGLLSSERGSAVIATCWNELDDPAAAHPHGSAAPPKLRNS
jgi:hypothetical protein